MAYITTTQELTRLLLIMEDAYWRLIDLRGDSELIDDDNDYIDEITTNLDQFFA